MRCHARKQDCDGVILDSCDLHRQAYNAAFRHFDLRNGAGNKCFSVLASRRTVAPSWIIDAGEGPIEWSAEYHAMMEEKVGLGFKLKLRWYFDEEGWPMTSLPGLEGRIPRAEEDRTRLVDALQEWKNEKYRQMLR